MTDWVEEEGREYVADVKSSLELLEFTEGIGAEKKGYRLMPFLISAGLRGLCRSVSSRKSTLVKRGKYKEHL